MTAHSGFMYEDSKQSNNTTTPSQLVFVQMSDVHLTDNKSKDLLFGNATNIDPIEFLNMTVQEIKSLKPAFVVVTGDIVAESDIQDTNRATKDFKAFNSSIQPLILSGIPVYEVVGNHDVVGVNNKTANMNESGYGKALFLKTFGLKNTYYSFDLSGYHFLVIDPNNIDTKWETNSKGLKFFINDTQLSWLTKNLSMAGGRSIVFIHEPTQDLENSEEVRKVLRDGGTEMIFSGHWHMNELVNASGVPEQISGALSAAWWQGPHIDGSSEGYRIVVLNGSKIVSFYRATGYSRQINIVEPTEAIVNGDNITLKAQIWSDIAVKSASFHFDNDSYFPMSLSREGIWYIASANFNASKLIKGYHSLEINVIDDKGSFSTNSSLKASENKILTIGELLAHYKTYMGKQVMIKGIVMSVFESSLPIFQDLTGRIPVYTGECINPPKFTRGGRWTIKAKLAESNWKPELKLISAQDAVRATAPSVSAVYSAGGFAGKSFTWDYSFYVPSGTTSISTDDPIHIKWNGLVATMKYSTAGDYIVRFTLNSPSGSTTGSGKVHIVKEKVWGLHSHRAIWDDKYMVTGIDQQAEMLKINTVTYENTVNGGFYNLENFLNQTKLYVWPDLNTPPSDSQQTPYYHDYEKWAEAFANLSLVHPNLDGFLINDIHPDVNTFFTPAYLKRILQAKNRINPNLRMLPVLYYDYVSYDELKYFTPGNIYKPVLSVDGTTIWYWRSYSPNSIDMDQFSRYLRDSEKYIHPAPYVVGLYPIANVGEDSQMYHTKTDIYNMIVAADRNSEGIILYDVPWTASTKADIDLHDAIVQAFSCST